VERGGPAAAFLFCKGQGAPAGRRKLSFLGFFLFCVASF